MHRHQGGFNFSNQLRGCTYSNQQLIASGLEPPVPVDTGTTVVGIHFANGIMLGTDSRTTRKTTVNSSCTQKIYRLHKNVYCGGSGYGNDLNNMTRIIAAQLDMHYNTTNNRPVPIVCAKQITKEIIMHYIGKILVSFILGGVDNTGLYIYTIHFDGTSEKCLYNAVGSGQFGAIGVLENRWHLNMEENDARKLMIDAVTAGINSDLISGSKIDICIIRDDFSVDISSEELFTNSRDFKAEIRNVELGATRIRSSWTNNIHIKRQRITYLPTATPSAMTPPLWQQSKSFEECPYPNRKRSATNLHFNDEPVRKRKRGISC